ncbi:MAG: hypothetical protein GX567_19525, partial [Clostridia bacterium]|nr:hypothetical protein [Clostridia bacterium]
MKLRLDLCFRALIVLGLLLGILYALFKNALYLLIPALTIFTPSIIALGWTTFRECARREPSINWTNQVINLKVFSIIYFISICVLIIYHTRTLMYFILLSILFGILTVQILMSTTSDRSSMPLLQIVSISINIVLGTNYIYPYYYSGGDTFVHVYYAQITSLGNTIPVSLDPAY